MKFIILGCGSSMGVPRPDGFFGNCDPKNKKNYRTRCSALIKSKTENILIDTSPDLRQQLLRHEIKKIDKVFYSHMHADQTHGINDLRSFYINSRKQINVFADYATSKYLKNSFSYCFKSYSKEYPATLKLNKINNKMYNIIEKNKNGKSLYTVVYSYGQLSLPMCQSTDYQHCVDYINKQPIETKVYNEEESQQALNKCLSEMYKNNSNPD